MEFAIGDKVVYPNHGVGVIENTHLRNVNGDDVRFYQLRLEENNSTVLIPVHHIATSGIRKMTSKRDVKALLRRIEASFLEEDPNPQDWKTRFKENTEKMRAGDISEVAEVLFGLAQVNNRKSLSFREKKMFDQAKKMLIAEISAVVGTSGAEIEQRIEELLHRTFKSPSPGAY